MGWVAPSVAADEAEAAALDARDIDAPLPEEVIDDEEEAMLAALEAEAQKSAEAEANAEATLAGTPTPTLCAPNPCQSVPIATLSAPSRWCGRRYRRGSRSSSSSIRRGNRCAAA